MQPVLINGEWRPSSGSQGFHAVNPSTREELEQQFPISPWDEIEHALIAADQAFQEVRGWPGERFAEFLEAYATKLTERAERIVDAAHLETALPASPRLKDVELPRTVAQLRQAAAAAREGSWALPTIDTAANIRSMLAPLGPVAVFGPNNFPLAFNSIAGGDFAAAIAAGNPVIAKGHPSHPYTTQLCGQAAHEAARKTGMPAGFVQLIYRTSHEDGARLVSHPLLGASGYTGSRYAGLALKEAADRAGNPIYLELSSINPVAILPGVLRERGDEIATEFTTSCLMGSGQFCTNPGVILLLAGKETDAFIKSVSDQFAAAPAGTLLGQGTESSLRAGIVALQRAGAEVLVGNQPADNSRFCYANTLLKASGQAFLENPHGLQSEAFGNCSLLVVSKDAAELRQVVENLEGNLTGTIYSSQSGDDEELYQLIEPPLRQRVGRLLNDKMPTGVAVSAAMNHGGPFPATGHPGFTAVGIPASLRRFGMLQCYDNVRAERLPPALQNANPSGNMWRLVDGRWTTEDVAAMPG